MRQLLTITSLLLVCMAGIGHAEEVYVNMDRIMQIESGGNPNAYNASSKATGLYQITPIVLKDFNQTMLKIPGYDNTYKQADLYDPQINAKIAHWYMNTRIPSLFKAYKLVDSVDHRLVAYNAGIRAVIRNLRPKETRDYIVKYHKGDL